MGSSEARRRLIFCRSHSHISHTAPHSSGEGQLRRCQAAVASGLDEITCGVWGEGGALLRLVERGQIKDILSAAAKVNLHATCMLHNLKPLLSNQNIPNAVTNMVFVVHGCNAEHSCKSDAMRL
jgi:hypothetical protein